MNRKKKDSVLVGHAERRTSPRLPPEAFPALNGAFLRGGASVKLIDISSGGALVESEERLTPNTKICLKITTIEGTFMLQGRILRSTISQLQGGPRYRSGIAFDDKFPLQATHPDAVTTEDIEAAAEQAATPATSPLHARQPQQPSADLRNPGMEETLTLTASMPQMPPGLQHYFEFIKINNW